ncbi:hypothetical protein LX15_005977 [Streptoalloteichus tenebrarius]|uniref:Tetratricopeptide repeat protein n=1 Tax=Streptoalloteichus tenebrarius (strain ATCC 17920 / DSM 40477 / JCM 4838 / CBS 697.72 / NBRC 16177 / NCIMB 11028 / NRRL B-12390 / A12253. 1 / ISP 5477) TaxID=1933 RepID=A0ABT1I368_STRSD|nr:tetratricopeptide repeat protein [Streptoalloteichus tenebrarius]MCP2262243.1 hypothetical protein [Streptoalloteichus tenebrarius]BFF00777.1 hypothetical protein GCM10020241_24520 [Streptoalloteichus tenebrarius]
MAKTKLQAVRKALGHTQQHVIRLLIQRARTRGISLPAPASLQTMLSRWENGHEEVTTPDYQKLFREIYGRTNEELGFPPEPEDESLEELRARIAVARSIDVETIEQFQQQVNLARTSDARFGATTVLDQLNSHIAQIQRILTYAVPLRYRARLSAVLTDASTLAGWNSLDRGAIKAAWDHHETAKLAAREADSPSLLAHATAQQAVILLDLGETAAAVENFEVARLLVDRHAPALLRGWLAAAHGEGLAAQGRRDDALRAFDEADALLPADPVDPRMPFLLLNRAHLARWRGSALTRLGEQEAIDHLEAAARAIPTAGRRAIRGEAGMLVDLAFAYAAAGDRDAALEYARKARQLVSQIGSDRQRRRLKRLVLPGSAEIA